MVEDASVGLMRSCILRERIDARHFLRWLHSLNSYPRSTESRLAFYSPMPSGFFFHFTDPLHPWDYNASSAHFIVHFVLRTFFCYLFINLCSVEIFCLQLLSCMISVIFFSCTWPWFNALAYSFMNVNLHLYLSFCIHSCGTCCFYNNFNDTSMILLIFK